MKKYWICTALVTSLCLPGHSQQSPASKNGSYLLSTNWLADGVFTRFSPGGASLGSRSTALAQILFYQQMQPQGAAQYTCSNGTAVHLDLSAKKYKFNGMETDSAAAAAYSYAVAAAIGKDFGGPGYRHTLNSAQGLERHFKCEAVFYAGFGGPVPYTTTEMLGLLEREKISQFADQNTARSLVRTEIDARRPLYFCFGNWSGFERAVVIDGYLEEADSFWVHINYGMGGHRNGWYRMDAAIETAGDLLIRNYITVRPKANGIKQIFNKYINPFKAGKAGN